MSFYYALLLFVAKFLSSNGYPQDFQTNLNQRSTTVDDVELSEYRLNTSVMPTHYRIEIEPFFEEAPKENKPFTFKGSVLITLRAHEAGVKEIQLHMDQLEYTRIVLKDNEGVTHDREEAVYQKETHKLKIPLEKELKTNVDYVLNIEYTGVLNDDLKGFYRSQYSQEGKKVWLAATQFEITNARRAFPVFDEPSFKAVFQLNIIRPETFGMSLTNTAREREDPIEETKKVREVFKSTPKMSPYLLAFVVQNFKGKQNQDKSFGVWARPEAESQLSYSFSVGEKLIKEMGTWVDYSFSKVPEIQKIDMIALPDMKPVSVK